MRRTLISLSILTSVLTLAGCANPFGKQTYIRDKSGDYVDAQAAEPIQLPEDNNAREFGDILVIPEITQEYDQLPAKFDAPRPVQRLSMREGDSFSLERSDEADWILAGEKPKEVWPKLVSFLELNDVVITRKDPGNGVIETTWADFGGDEKRGLMYRTFGPLVGVDDAETMENRFRFEVHNGVRADTSELRVMHQGRPPVAEGDVGSEPQEWDNLGERSRRLDHSLLGEMLVYFAQGDMDSSISLSARNLNIEDRTTFERDGNGNPVLTIRDMSFARTWASVSSALNQTGLKVVDRNRSAGIFYLADDAEQIDQPENKKGFWSGLFGGSKKKEAATDSDETLTVRVSNFPEVIQVSVEKNVNTSAPADVSEKLLKLIHENMK